MVDKFKNAFRQTYRHARNKLTPTYKRNASKLICNQIRAIDFYRHSKRIALYQAIQGEVDLTGLWKSAPLHGKYCYFPVLNKDLSLSFMPATYATEFYYNHFGIQEPKGNLDEALKPDELDIIFMPLVAFDPQGTRLGMGSGYYDRTLEHARARYLIGIAYEFQRMDYINPNPWDIPLTAIVTEYTTYWCSS